MITVKARELKPGMKLPGYTALIIKVRPYRDHLFGRPRIEVDMGYVKTYYSADDDVKIEENSKEVMH